MLRCVISNRYIGGLQSPLYAFMARDSPLDLFLFVFVFLLLSLTLFSFLFFCLYLLICFICKLKISLPF